jgi:hypothetical protein
MVCRISLLSFFIFFSGQCFSQQVIKTFNCDSLPTYVRSQDSFINKRIPEQYNDIIKIALSYYPELKKTNIVFRIKKQKAPLSARPTIGSTFLPASKRKYIITISNQPLEKLKPILLDSLSCNAQIGVIGHELSHITDFNNRNGIYFIRLLLAHLSTKYMDAFEYQTDKRCIDHKLGFQLLAWSKEVRQKLKITSWKGTKKNRIPAERYMNPATIEKLILQTY